MACLYQISSSTYKYVCIKKSKTSILVLNVGTIVLENGSRKMQLLLYLNAAHVYVEQHEY